MFAGLLREPPHRAWLVAEFRRMRPVTPGDFAAVLRQLTATGAAVPWGDILALVQAECELRRASRAPAGFR
jgi:hypothetical protein